MMIKPKFLSSAIASSLMMAPLLAPADEQVITMEPLTVQGILPNHLDSLPGSYQIIDEKYLQERRPLSNLERMRAVPGLHVVADGSMGFDVNIGFRGQDPRRSSKAMIMEDGVPLQLAPYLDPVVHYTPPSSAISRIEVIKGAGQTLYGPQTMGGAVNFITRPIPRNGEVEGSITARLGNQDFRGLDTSIGYGNKFGGFTLDYSQIGGDGIFDGTDYDVKDYRFKGELDITERQTIGLKVVHTRDRRQMTENYLTRDEYDRDPHFHPTAKLDEWEQDRDIVQLSHKFKANDRLTISTQAYYTDTFRNGVRASDEGELVNGVWESSFRDCSAVGDTNGDGNTTTSDLGNTDVGVCGGRHAPRQYYTWGIESRADFNHQLFGLEHDTIIGLRYHEEKAHRQEVYASNAAQRESYRLALLNGYDREGARLEAKALSYYAANTTYIGDWAITPSFRVEDVRTSDKDEFTGEKESDNFTEFLPSFGVSWNGLANTSIFAGVHRGMTPARADREFSSDGGRAKPEKSTLYELGFRSHYFNGMYFEATLFHNDIEDTIVDNGSTFDNSGESQQTGIELAGRIDFGDIYGSENNIYLAGAYTNLWTAEYEKAEDPANNGNRMQYAPEHILNLDLGYAHHSGIDARIGVLYVSKQFGDDENTRIENGNGMEGIIPSYTIWNATVNYAIPNTDVTVFASVENMFDKEYLVSRNEGMLVGRDRLFFGGINYKF